MKPSFALNLTSDSVGLLQRTADGWRDIGSVPFDAPDLPEALGALRATVDGTASAGLTTKIVLPNSQILYTEVTAPGPDNGARRSQIRAALEGLTPYAVRELVFDWHGTGETVKVAVVARETLKEAEEFAEEHQFNPLSFVAAPEADQFGKEPWFGTTGGAQKRLPKGEKVERDQEVVRLIGAEGPPAAEADPVALPEPEAAVLPEPEAAAPLPETLEGDAVAELPPEAEPAPVEERPEVQGPQPEAQAEPVASPAAKLPATPEPEVLAERFADVILPPAKEAPAAAATADEPGLPEPEPETSEAAPEALPPAEPEFVPPPFTRSDKPIPHARDLPPFAPVTPPPPVKQRAQPSVSEADIPEAPYVEVGEAAEQAAAFSSRRAAEASLAPAGPAFGGKPVRGAKPGAAPERSATPPRPAAAKPFGAGPAPAAQRASGLSVTAPGIPGSRNRKPAKPAPQPAIPPLPASPAPAPSAAKGNSMGTFGARQLPQRGKPRHLGLILTAILLLVLAAIAAWTSFSGSASEEAPSSEISALPGVDEEMLADLQDPAEFAALPEAEAEADAAIAPDSMASTASAGSVEAPTAVEPAAEEVAAVAPAAEAPQVAETASALPAASGTATPESAQDEIFLTAMDAPQPTLDAVALPNPPVAPDAAPGAQMPPPPFGTVYEFDADGMIVPTAEGIVAPGGFLLVAGPPPINPPSRPAPEVPEAAAPEAAAAEAAATTTPGAILQTAPAATAPEPYADPALADARPRSRPAALEPAPAAEDDAAIAPEEATQTASLRPRLRPAGMVPDVETAQEAAQGATLRMVAPAPRPDDIPDVAAAADGSISPLAIAVSRRPATRPSDFSGAIEAAVAAAVQQPAAAPAAAAVARVEPEEMEEPEVVAAVAPRIPTRASVAQQATFANAINLRQLNLIGVYGTSSNRYALVRQSNGRYSRVSVGDRLDGGTVAAITTNELRYRKGSRMLALQMPRG